VGKDGMPSKILLYMIKSDTQIYSDIQVFRLCGSYSITWQSKVQKTLRGHVCGVHCVNLC